MAKLSSCLDEATAGSLNDTRWDHTRGQHKKSFWVTNGGIPIVLWGKGEEERERRNRQEEEKKEERSRKLEQIAYWVA